MSTIFNDFEGKQCSAKGRWIWGFFYLETVETLEKTAFEEIEEEIRFK